MGFQNSKALFVPQSCLRLSKFSFLVTLPFSKQSAQVYIHSGACKWRVYSIVSIWPISSLQILVDWFSCIFFLPKVNSTHLALKEERCYFGPKYRLFQEHGMNQPQPGWRSEAPGTAQVLALLNYCTSGIWPPKAQPGNKNQKLAFCWRNIIQMSHFWCWQLQPASLWGPQSLRS